MVPSYLESVLASGDMPNADLVLYSISPSHAIPASYPMLDPRCVQISSSFRLLSHAHITPTYLS